MRKKYVKPTIKSVEWKFQDPICNTVYQHSGCIIIDDDAAGNTRHEHVHSYSSDDLGSWTQTPGNNSRWN